MSEESSLHHVPAHSEKTAAGRQDKWSVNAGLRQHYCSRYFCFWSSANFGCSNRIQTEGLTTTWVSLLCATWYRLKQQSWHPLGAHRNAKFQAYLKLLNPNLPLTSSPANSLFTLRLEKYQPGWYLEGTILHGVSSNQLDFWRGSFSTWVVWISLIRAKCE